MDSYNNIQYGDGWYSDTKGTLHMTWDFKYLINGFEVHIYVEGTEQDAVDYLESEYGYMSGITGGWYHALTANEIKLVKQLGYPIYLA